jgi:phosphate transport system permease protein
MKSSEIYFKYFLLVIASFIVLLLILYFAVIGKESIPALSKFGLSFITGSTWNPPREIFQLFPEILGTFATSIIALSIGFPISIGTAIFLSEICPQGLRDILGSIVELLAAVPSVVYGFWGLAIFVPSFLYPVENLLKDSLGFIPLLSSDDGITGYNTLSAGVVLAIMVIPIMSSVCRESFLYVPSSQREAAYALGATKSEALRSAVIGYAKPGIIASIFLGFGRALGETMAVTMIIGNALQFKYSLMMPSQTLASLIANQYAEAIGQTAISSVIAAGFVLLVLSFLVNVGARVIIRRLLARSAELI